MWQLTIVLLIFHSIATAHASDIPPFANRLIKIFDKLDKLTASVELPSTLLQPQSEVKPEPVNVTCLPQVETTHSPEGKLFAKLEKLNAIKPKDVNSPTTTDDLNSESVENANVSKVYTIQTTPATSTKATTVTQKPKQKNRNTTEHSHAPDKVLTEDDDELLSVMQIMGKMSPDQLENVALEMMRVKGGNKVPVPDYDADWEDDLNLLGEEDYPNDDWDNEYADSMPVSITKVGPGLEEYTFVDPVRATAQRPKVVYERPSYISHYLAAALAHIKSVVTNGKCNIPQPRWLNVKQLAPAADIVYMPSQVLLHRCTEDSGCCLDESQVCAPVKGEYVTIPFYLNKANGNFVARLVFYNHTRCGCISRSTTAPSPTNATTTTTRRHVVQAPTRRKEESSESAEGVMATYNERSMEQDGAPVTQEPFSQPTDLSRCTCPTLFQAKHSDGGGCSCVCEWPEQNRRRDCLSLARGREHFGLRDRVCVANGDCMMPTCEYGMYDKSSGRCPIRRVKRRYPKGRMG